MISDVQMLAQVKDYEKDPVSINIDFEIDGGIHETHEMEISGGNVLMLRSPSVRGCSS